VFLLFKKGPAESPTLDFGAENYKIKVKNDVDPLNSLSVKLGILTEFQIYESSFLCRPSPFEPILRTR
jgi:hypothetical protein